MEVARLGSVPLQNMHRLISQNLAFLLLVLFCNGMCRYSVPALFQVMKNKNYYF